MTTFISPPWSYCSFYKDCNLKEQFQKGNGDTVFDNIFKRMQHYEMPDNLNLAVECNLFNPVPIKREISKDGEIKFITPNNQD